MTDDQKASPQPIDIGSEEYRIYLSQKAADAAVQGDVEKAKHHTISSAAALANWHLALSGGDNRFQPGITPKPAEMIV